MPHRIDPSSEAKGSPIELEREPAGAASAPRISGAAGIFGAPGAYAPTKEGTGVARRCGNCGYDLSGLAARICPECGVSVESARRSGNIRAAVREDHIRSGIILGVSWLVLFGLVMLLGGSGDVKWFITKQVASIAVGSVVYVVCVALWIGVNMPWGVALMRVATVIAIGDAAGLLLYFVPMLFIQPLVAGVVMIGATMKLLDIDATDGFLLGVLLAGMRWALLLALSAWF